MPKARVLSQGMRGGGVLINQHIPQRMSCSEESVRNQAVLQALAGIASGRHRAVYRM
jgi:hypothetical protein